MNVHAPVAEFQAVRWRFTVRDVERMAEAGILKDTDRVELVEGELIQLPPKSPDHENPRNRLVRRLNRLLPDRYMAAGETTLRFSEHSYVEPDVLVYDDTNGAEGLDEDTVILAVEISVSTVKYDLGRKADLYASYGIRELWVVDVAERMVIVHREPIEGSYRSVQRRSVTEPVLPIHFPDIAITFADFM